MVINLKYKRPLQEKNILKLFGLSLIIKIAIAVITIIFVNLGWFNNGDDHLLWGNLRWQHICEIYFNSDSGWYKVIAENGYAHVPLSESNNWSAPNLHFAFFPLFPLCIRLVMEISGMGFFSAAFCLNIIVLYPLVRYFYLFMLHYGIEAKQAFKGVVLFLLFPFSMHIYFIYTEALFFTLVIASFFFIAKKQWLKFAISAALVTLTRPNGLILLVPFFLYIVENNGGFKWGNIKALLKHPFVYTLIAMPLAFFVWMYVQHAITGNWMASAAAQAGWKKHWMFPLLALFRNGFWQEQLASIYAIMIMLVAIYFYKKWAPSINAFVWIIILLPLSAGSVISMTRYLSMLFPYYLQAAASQWLNRYYKTITVLLIALQLAVLKLWIEDNSLMY